eukprot:IDg5807t1
MGPSKENHFATIYDYDTASGNVNIHAPPHHSTTPEQTMYTSWRCMVSMQPLTDSHFLPLQILIQNGPAPPNPSCLPDDHLQDLFVTMKPTSRSVNARNARPNPEAPFDSPSRASRSSTTAKHLNDFAITPKSLYPTLPHLLESQTL